MPLHRCSEQTRLTLEEFYSEIEQREGSFYGQDMLELIKEINNAFPKTTLWGLTSHYRLVIIKDNNSKTDWFIIISALAGEFYFEYLIPAIKAPWENAYVRGTAKSPEQAMKFLLIAMKECEGWKENDELNKLLSLYFPN